MENRNIALLTREGKVIGNKRMHRKFTKSWTKHMDFIILDVLCLQLAFIIAYMVRHGFASPYRTRIYGSMAVILLLADVVIVLLMETFKNVLKRGYYKEFVATVKQVVLVELVSVMYLFSTQSGEDYSRSVLYMTGIFYGVISYAVRILWKIVLKKRMTLKGAVSLLIISDEQSAESVIDNIRANNYKFYNISGVILVDKDRTGDSISDVPVVATEETAAEYVCREWIDEVLVVVRQDVTYSKEMLSKLMETGVTVHVNISDVFGKNKDKQYVEKVGDYTVVTNSIGYVSTRQLIFKRTIDIIGGFVGCIATGLIALVIGPIIYIKSPGPIFFSQTRVGKNGKKFKIYKFRSMYPDAEERKKELMQDNLVKDGMMFKVDFDTRIIGNKILPNGEKKTGIGQFIRKTSLDEFPQFFNVLRGDMSLVGTRPPTVDEYEKYQLHHRARLAIKPGITGLWQVSGRSNITDFEEVVKLDTKYITEWSIGLEFRIMLQTILVVFKQKGSM